MLPLLALHDIAARRGDGLRPELLRLLGRSRAHPEDRRASAPPRGDRPTAPPPPGPAPAPAPAETDPSHEGVLRFPASRR